MQAVIADKLVLYFADLACAYYDMLHNKMNRAHARIVERNKIRKPFVESVVAWRDRLKSKIPTSYDPSICSAASRSLCKAVVQS